MSLAHGRHLLAIPGPSVMPDRVLAAMHRAAPNIYAGELVDITASIVADLREVARTRHNVAIYIGNGHAAWEAALSNVVEAGDRVLVLSTGSFAQGWAEIARRLGVEVETEDFGRTAPIDPARVAERLSADRGHALRAVLMVHSDTSTSVRSDVAAVRAAIDAAGHPALLCVDCIASLACDVFEMDLWGVDVMVAASQKGLMTPPGLGLVWFGPRAAEARARLTRVSSYWDWVKRAAPENLSQRFCGTAPTHHLFGLREALTMLLREEGLEAAWRRHATLARAVWAAFEAWGAEGPVALNVPDRAHRSHAVTSVRIGAPHGTALRDWLSEKAGLTLGIGLGMAPAGDPAWHGFFRVGHMGHVNAHMVLGTLGAIEAGMRALGLPFGRGGLEAAAAVVSEA